MTPVQTPPGTRSAGAESQPERVTDWLARHGVQHSKLLVVPFTSVNERESYNYQTRPENLDPQTVEEYAAAMRRGDLFPPAVVFRRADRLVIISGKHRYAAAKRNGGWGSPRGTIDKAILAYQVAEDTPSEILLLLSVEANSRHGRPVTAEWKQQQAEALAHAGFGTEQIAAALGVSDQWVAQALRVSTANERASELRVSGWRDLTITARAQLAAIKSDVVFEAAARTVIETRMGSGKPIQELVRDVNRQRSESDQLRYLGTVYEERRQQMDLAAKQGARRLPSYRSQVSSALGCVLALDPGRVAGHFQQEIEIRELMSRVEASIEKLFEIQGALERKLDTARPKAS